MKYRFAWFGLVSGAVFTALIFLSYSQSVSETDSPNLAPNLPQMIRPVNLDKEFSFAGESIPRTFDVIERLDRELLVNAYWQSSTLMNIKLANRYFPVMEPILAEQGIPDDFKYLAAAESNFRHGVSAANAVGLWQFRKLAAKEWGLEVNHEVDERYHVEKSTLAACKYLNWLYKKTGSWLNAAAAYNVGPTKFRRLLSEQGENDYFDLNLNEETMRYVFRLVAFKEILSDPYSYGFYVESDEKYQPLDNYYEVKVNSSVSSWSNFADKYGISYRDLKVYNPWLRDTKMTVKKNTYYVKIPK
jgi:hypothetical protein